jgi:hypothetical protein
MTDEHANDVLRELQAQLTVEPSAAFAAGVRARVAAEPARTGLGWWRPVVAVAASVAVLAGVWIARGHGRAPVAAPMAVVAADTATVPLVAAAAAGVPTPAPTPASPKRPAARPSRGAVRSIEAEVPRALVPADQRIALRQLLAAVRDGRASVPGAPSTVDEITGELKPLMAIDVPLIVVEPLPASARSGGGR